MALGKQLCLDYRGRVFGYLAAVLQASEKSWAEAELQRAKDARTHIDDLKQKLGQAQMNLVSSTQNVIDEFKPSGSAADTASKALAANRRTNEDTIKSLQTPAQRCQA